MRRLLAACTCWVVILTANAASAIAPHDSDEVSAVAPPPADAAPAGPNVWYGWQILLPDVIAIGLAAAGPAFQFNEAMMATSGFIYGSTGLIIHSVHGRVRTGLASVLIRGALVATGALIGFGVGSSVAGPCDTSGFGCIGVAAYSAFGLYMGALVGAGGATAIDVAALGWQPQAPVKPSSVSWSFAPRVMQNGGGLSVVGSF